MIKESCFNEGNVQMLELLYILADKVPDTHMYVENGKIYLEVLDNEKI